MPRQTREDSQLGVGLVVTGEWVGRSGCHGLMDLTPGGGTGFRLIPKHANVEVPLPSWRPAVGKRESDVMAGELQTRTGSVSQGTIMS